LVYPPAMRLGFEFQEVMSGTYTRTGQPAQSGEMRLEVRARAADALQHLRDGLVELEGTLDMTGLATDVPVSGTVEIRPFTRKIIRYDFSFTGDDGQPYRFTGQKDIRFADFLATITNLSGAVITDASGAEVARAALRFDLKADLLPFLVSWKPSLG
jgi:hypothetical protein